MNKDLLTKLRKTKSVTLSNSVVRTLDDAQLASIVGGLKSATTRTDSCSGGICDDCLD